MSPTGANGHSEKPTPVKGTLRMVSLYAMFQGTGSNLGTPGVGWIYPVEGIHWALTKDNKRAVNMTAASSFGILTEVDSARPLVSPRSKGTHTQKLFDECALLLVPRTCQIIITAAF